ncbi:bromodomain adjacent to zinc finger domain protein 1A [Lingula anatina]|uniref:Bromodomain adjacent to zinc finger domain protein 1A n=1 Tax=Lingula anatina TaxID=7574 RepID=A0A2R2ML19_LINAN|nr:bromodomain adjacent to zinc finger domain protein 1A [Lingula anatina]|eukprot:XP_023930895.1 bromodomain adjacent to zinc finger domain protein 1A [Lingula anatina]
MPLLKRQPFEKNSVPSDIKPDEEVFYCPLTNEIFRDYEEFFERIILCNSLVWSCSITGRSGLTYQEALESEERARKHLSSFPFYLHKPILFLATKTHRSRLNDMNDDVFVFTKDRYFVGEVVEVIHEGERKSCKILKVLPPTPLPNGDVNGTSPSTSEAADQEDVDNYRYVVQKIGKGEKGDPFIADAPDVNRKKGLYTRDKSKLFLKSHCEASEGIWKVKAKERKGDPFIADAPDVNRKKGLYTRDKSKLFLKSHCEASEGIWKVKEKYIRKHHLNEVNFKSMFPSAIPTFETSEVKKKPKQNKSDVDLLLKKAKKEHKEKKEKKEKKQKIDEKEPKKLTEEEKEAMKQKLLLEKEAMKALKLAEKQEKQEELRKKLEEEKERRREEREKLKEEKKLKAEYLKEWSKPRDDMECDDLKVLPDPTPVKTGIPEELFGDVMMVLEMLHVFGPLLEIKDEFPHGVSMDMMEKALLEKDVDGTLADLLGFLLVSIFNLQQEEEEEEEEIEKEEKDGNLTAERVETIDEDTDIADLSTKDLIQAATVASQWPHLYHGTPLRNLQLDSLTLTEILRLHFLSSGAHANASNAKFRYQQRGGYTSLDDAGMEFKMQESAIIKALSTYNVFDLSPGKW